ncbi:MAG: tRNA pseudouridine(38-40) synthase TruA [Desulfobacterales bacterium]|nr:tRNA pseudouridine(38-40) synthase TruA [Desulfobacterales bacterium]MDD4071976.1 tRNA pseudouridine(38-40) synthase TruA [Desulfobacterales bacterium]MDD4391720.1 tRNA pseudouridine(38-40) synthase TruA [Desulfobacterales bacterium]
MRQETPKNFKLVIEYDGSAYHGWQRQKHHPTVQEKIEKALHTMTGEIIILNGSGRTDAGVHALGQVANFKCPTALTPPVFLKGLNSLLPDDIVITSCEQTDIKFHARFDAKSKTYRYCILNREIPSAVNRQYAWFVRRHLNVDEMKKGAAHMIGTHDFKSFEKTGSPRPHTIRTVMKVDLIIKDDAHIFIDVEANGFLRCMVRNMVGTLVCVGSAKLTAEDIIRIIRSKNRKLAGPTAPAHGLFLKQVYY